MVSLEQSEIAKCLYDFANLNYLILENHDQKIKYLFDFYMKDEIDINKEEYFKKIINVYTIFLKLKTFCIAEEYNIKNNFINNNNLDLQNIRNNITRGNDLNISDKALLKNIRNAFCHSTKQNQMYNMSLNGRFVNFNIDSSNIKMDINDIINLSNKINDATQTLQFLTLNFDKEYTNIKELLKSIDFNRYYITKKIEFDTINSMVELGNQNKHKEFIDLADDIEDCTKKTFNLTDEQINNILKVINDLIKNNIITKEELKNNLIEIINILIVKQLPIPISKIQQYKVDSFIANYLYKMDLFSYDDIYKIVTILLPNKEVEQFSLEEYYNASFKNEYDELFIKLSSYDFNEKMVYPYMLFIEYVITNFCNSEYIKIGKRTVLQNKLRNSLVHCRWIIDGEFIKFYDALPIVLNEMEYNFKCKLSFVDLLEYCVSIMEKELNVNNEKIYKKIKAF